MFSEDKIDDRIIHLLLENANWAPTHGLTQPWKFTVFAGAGSKRLAEFQAGLYKDVSEKDGVFDENKYEKLQNKPLKCSHIIAIGMKRSVGSKIPEIEEIESVAMAVQNMYLTACAHGIGCYWGSGGVTYYEEAKSFFGLEPEDKLLGFMYLGIPKTKWPVGKRDPIDQKVNWVSGE